MTGRIFLGRHGQSHDDDVTAYGMERLSLLRSRLEARGFRATACISSPLKRAVETARFLAYGAGPATYPWLEAFDYHRTHVRVYPEGWGGHVIRMDVRAYADRVIAELEPLIRSSEDLVIISHDFASTYLGRKLLELNGARDPWGVVDAPDETFPNQGEGWLIEGTTFERFMEKA